MVPQLPPQRPGWPSQSSFRGGPTGEFVSWGPICTCKHEIPQTLGGLPKPWFIVGKNHHHISSLRVSFVNLHGCHCGFLLFRPFTLFTHQKPSVPESTQAQLKDAPCYIKTKDWLITWPCSVSFSYRSKQLRLVNVSLESIRWFQICDSDLTCPQVAVPLVHCISPSLCGHAPTIQLLLIFRFKTSWWFQMFFGFHLGKSSNLTSIFFKWVVQAPTIS